MRVQPSRETHCRRMLEPRLYRVAFVPVLLALLVAAFSLQDRPRPIGTTQAPEAFDEIRAGQTLDDLARRFPVRRPGDAADTRLASEIAAAARDRARHRGGTPLSRARRSTAARDLIDVVATRPGVPGPPIVVVAHRDAANTDPAHPTKAELSATAALLELARVAADGGGCAGPSPSSRPRVAAGLRGRGEEARRMSSRADAVLVLGAVGGTATAGGRSSSRSPTAVGAPVQLQRTVQAAVRAEVGSDAGAPRALTQWLRMAVPVTISEQGAVPARRSAGRAAVGLG